MFVSRHYNKIHILSFVVLLICMIAVIAQGIIFDWSPVDDAYIGFRYARNLAQGHGLVFNVGERVEGYTNFLWTVMLASMAYIGLDLPQAGKWLSVFFSLVGLVLIWRLAVVVAEERGWPKLLPLGVPFIVVCFPGFSYWAFSGMEPSLLMSLVLMFLILGCKKSASLLRLFLAGVFGFLAAITRWEVVLLWPIVVMSCFFDRSHVFYRKISRALFLSAVLLIFFGLYFIFRFQYYGAILPNTFYTKMGAAFIPRFLKGLVYAGEFSVEWLLFLTFLNWIFRRRGRWSLVLSLCLIVYVCYVTWVGGDFFPWLRFYYAVFGIAAIMAVDFVGSVSRSFESEVSRRIVTVLLVVAMGLSISGISFRIDYIGAVGQLRWVRDWQEVGKWSKKNIPQDYKIAIAPIGAVGYYSERYIIDIMGLTDYETAHFGDVDSAEGPGHQRSYIGSVLRRKPEIILGQGLLFDYYPGKEEVVRGSVRSALKKMYRMPEFEDIYAFKVNKYGRNYIAYWIRRDLDSLSD